MSPSRFTFATVSVAVATLIALTACGGGSSTSPTSTGGATSNPSTPSTPVTVTVMDGLIRNAKVCVDSNNNNACDAGEIQGSTDANGQVTLSIPTDSLGAAKIVANVGTDAVDVDNGAVPTAFTMTAPATGGGTTAVVSPLTTMVQTKMETDKVSLQDAINYVKAQTGLTTASPMDNFIEKRASSAEHRKAGDVARLLVLSMQKSKTVAASTTATATATTAATTACLTGSTESENERIKDSNINTSLSARLSDFRKTSDDLDDENERDDDNDDRKRTVAPVVPVCGTTATTTPTTTNTAAVNGKALFASACASCHGATNTGMGANASATLRAIATNKGGMGFLSSTIGAQQAADIAAYAANPAAVQ